jgi:aryl-alcohol dehydrogenase-like predicted oxidoreductase
LTLKNELMRRRAGQNALGFAPERMMVDKTSLQWSRRDALSLALSVGLSTWCRRVRAAAPDALVTKVIPASGEHLPVIGIGTNAFTESKRSELRGVLQRMTDLGGSVIDTAASYGDSEQVLGELITDLKIRDKVFLATKLTADSDATDSFARSLKRLQTDRLDLLQVHNLRGFENLWPQLQAWKKAGKIRYIGTTTSFSTDHAHMVELMRKYPLDFVQVDYSIANRDAAGTVLPVAHERRIAVIANIPLGGRGGANLSTSGARPLPPFAAQLGVTDWPQFMLKYVVSHPAVTCTIAGSTKTTHLEDNQAAGRGSLPDAAQRVAMEQAWDRLGSV